jgi:hypothetical protein
VLKDALRAVAQGESKKICKFGSITTSLDNDTREALILAMASEASTMDITRALCSDGHSIGRDVVGTKRACFKDPSFNCCIRETIDTCIATNEGK